MDLRVDESSPIPIYHQIAEAIRYRVATGMLRPGQRLPSARDGAARWNVHFHTVRRAYQQLAKLGIVVIAGARGVSVVAGHGARANEVSRFIERFSREAARRFGLTPFDLARSVIAGSSATRPWAGPVYVLECSLDQCQDLASQIRSQFRVDAVPWPISTPDPLPAGELVATMFHYNDLRYRSPERLATIRFLSIRLDPALAAQLAPHLASGATLVVSDPEAEMSRNIAADLVGLLGGPSRAALEISADRTRLVPRPGCLHFVSPRLWGRLGDEERQRPDIVLARYVFDPRELLDLAASLRWSPADPAESAA